MDAAALRGVDKQRKAISKPNNGGKRGAKKKQPVKVVYISNPMKVEASESQFSALVQKLTGRDAEFPDPENFPGLFDGGGGSSSASGGDRRDEGAATLTSDGSPQGVVPAAETTSTSDLSFDQLEVDDDVFLPFIRDSVGGPLPPYADVSEAFLDVKFN